MDKKHEKYKARLADELPKNITANTILCLADNGITTVGELIDRWQMLDLVTKDRFSFKAMLKGFGVRAAQVDHIANFCASFSFRLQADREANLLYQKIGGKFVPVESLAGWGSGMSEGIYLVRVNGNRGFIRSIHSLTALADEVGWFRVAGKPWLDFEPIAKIDYYAEALIDFVSDKYNLMEMSPVQLAEHLAKLMLEVTENERSKEYERPNGIGAC